MRRLRPWASARSAHAPGWVRVLASLLLVAGASGLACRDSDSGTGRAARSAAPVFSLPALDGREIGLAAQLGKIVIVDFWATWCTPCEAQMPVLDALWAEEGGDGLEVIGVSVDTIAAPEIEAWVAERGFRYPIVLGDQELAMRYGVIGFPTLFVIDPAGMIHTRHTGVLDRPELDEILEAIRVEFSPSGAAPD